MTQQMVNYIKALYALAIVLMLSSCCFHDQVPLKNIDKKHPLGGGYYADNESIYLTGEHDSFFLFKQAEYSSFKVLKGGIYSKDRNSVYYQYGAISNTLDIEDKIEEADPKTFKALNENYAKDKNHVFYERKIIKDADTRSFKVINTFYAKDKNNVYYDGEIVKDANPEIFVVFGDDYFIGFYGKDENNFYHGREKIKDVPDPRTFRPLTATICKDNQKIYYVADSNNLVVADFDYDSFEVFESYLYGKDKDAVYSFYKEDSTNKERLKFPGIDPETAEEIEINPLYFDLLKDKYHVYIDEKVLPGADASTFEYLTVDYYKDKNHVYRFNGEILEGVNPQTFDPEKFNFLEWEKSQKK